MRTRAQQWRLSQRKRVSFRTSLVASFFRWRIGNEPHALVHERVDLLQKAAPRSIFVDGDFAAIEDDAASDHDRARITRIFRDLEMSAAEITTGNITFGWERSPRTSGRGNDPNA